jgi:hypothetical protein
MNTPCRFPQRSENCVLHIRKKSASLHRASTVKCTGGTHGDCPNPDAHWDPGNLQWSVVQPGQSKSWSMPPLRQDYRPDPLLWFASTPQLPLRKKGNKRNVGNRKRRNSFARERRHGCKKTKVAAKTEGDAQASKAERKLTRATLIELYGARRYGGLMLLRRWVSPIAQPNATGLS